MAIITTYADSKGIVHKTPRETALANLSLIFGEQTSAQALAKLVLDNREAVEAAFLEFDGDHAHEQAKLAATHPEDAPFSNKDICL